MKVIEKEVHGSSQNLELKISLFLRWGVVFAGAVILCGWTARLFRGESIETLDFSTYSPLPLFETVQWAVIHRDRGLLMSVVGLGLLVCLPVVRVFLTGLLFLYRRELRMAAMTFFVFLVLVTSFFLGLSSH